MSFNLPQLNHQPVVREYFDSALEGGRIPHALILAGARGSGKFDTALAFAMRVIGTDNPEHPDIKVVEFPKEKPEYVATVRDLVVSNMQLAPYRGSHKFYIIKEAHRMNSQAQNALLKSIEEPPEYASVIMLSGDMAGLLPTIRSRSVKLVFTPVIKSDEDYLLKADAVASAFCRALSGQPDPGDYKTEAAMFKEDPDIFLELMEIFIRDVLVYKLTLDGGRLALPAWSEKIKKATKEADFSRLGRVDKRILGTKTALAANVLNETLFNLLLFEIGGNIENTYRNTL